SLPAHSQLATSRGEETSAIDVSFPVKAEITSILMVTGKENAGAFLDLLGSGKDFVARFQFALQEEERMKSGGVTRCDIIMEGKD
ncbi:MAG: hypothetical protein ACP5TI_06605, partial [Thermoprotei archaeon]